MSRKKASVEQDDWMLKEYGRPLVYDSEILIEMCMRFISGQQLTAICKLPGNPVPPVLYGWIEEGKEGYAIYQSACTFKANRKLALDLDLPSRVASSIEWAQEIRANLKRSWPADYKGRKFIPPDWNKVRKEYPSMGDSPVRPNENRKAYDDLLGVFTRMVEPRDEIELIWTKQAADATWEETRLAREKNALPEWKHQRRHALDIAQSRAIKRRDHALRQIECWRADLGATPRRLPDELLPEEALAEHYAANEFLTEAQRIASWSRLRRMRPRLLPTVRLGRKSAQKRRRRMLVLVARSRTRPLKRHRRSRIKTCLQKLSIRALIPTRPRSLRPGLLLPARLRKLCCTPLL
jgi:hypothetical protein